MTMHELAGGCHCGTIRVMYRTGTAPEAHAPRACQCSFCRKHNTRAVSDPAGSLEIAVSDPARLNRYRFGRGTVDFLICRECGVYVAAFSAEPDDASGYATLMANVLDAQGRFPPGMAKIYDDEDVASRAERRRKVWTPAKLVVAEQPAPGAVEA
jgi:hypothetical protein